MPKRTPEGIVSLLDAPHSGLVEELWDRIEAATGLAGVRITPYPHFSYLVGDRLDRKGVDEALRQLARSTSPFSVRVRGVGTFPAPWPVVYLRVEPEARLRQFHRRLWEAVHPAVTRPWSYYDPAAWVPHVTLAHGDEPAGNPLTAAEVEQVSRLVSRRRIDWTAPVDHVATIVDERGHQRLGQRFPFEGPSA